jgi:hypothetical protein
VTDSARTPGRRLHDRLEGSEISAGSKYYDRMNPAVQAAWERLAAEIDKEMEGLGLRLNDAERDREYSEQREEKLREALKQIAGDADVHINGVTQTGTLDGMAARAVARAALAENGDTDPGGLGDRRPGA